MSTTTRYLIVGGGMAADAAVRGIREVDPDGPITLIGAEPDPPYDRPPLSKALWKDTPLDAIWRGTEARDVSLHLGRQVIGLDLDAGSVRDDHGDRYGFDRLLLATGGAPRRLPFGGDAVLYFRTLADYRRLRQLATESERVVVMGGGFIGSEIAAALAMNGRKVTMVFPEPAIGARVFPADLAEFVTQTYLDRGVDVRPGTRVVGIDGEPGAAKVRIEMSGRVIPLSPAAVVAGLGIRPATELAANAGLAVDDGIVVDETLRTSHPRVYAAGDVAAFPSASQGRTIRVEHEDNAVTMGAVAGRNMAGHSEPYRHQPLFYSDLFDLGYEAVGHLDASLETVADWREPFREGIVYYLDHGRLRGILLWNVWERVDAARSLIADGRSWRAAELRGAID